MLHYTKIFFVLMFKVPKHMEYCRLGATRKVNNNLSGKLARQCVKQADWSWKGAFGFGFAFNDTHRGPFQPLTFCDSVIRFGLVLKLAALPKAIFTGSYCGKKPIRHKRIPKSEKNAFSGYEERVLLRKQSTCLTI